MGGGAASNWRSLILRTTDGGQTWEEWDKVVEGVYLTSVYTRRFANADYVWIGGWNGVIIRITGELANQYHGYHTNDWEGQPNITGMHFFVSTEFGRDFDSGIITRFGSSRYGMLRKYCCLGWSSVNQYGSYFNEINFPYALEDVHFSFDLSLPYPYNDSNGWVVGFTTERRTASDWDYIGIVGRTTDRGLSWELIKSNVNARFLAVHSMNEHKAWIAGRSGGSSSSGGVIYRTTDGGENWELQLSVSRPITDIHFTDLFNGWAITSGGTIYRTRDGGENWYIEASSLGSLNAIDFTDRNHGWVVGARGRIYRYYPVE